MSNPFVFQRRHKIEWDVINDCQLYSSNVVCRHACSPPRPPFNPTRDLFPNNNETTTQTIHSSMGCACFLPHSSERPTSSSVVHHLTTSFSIWAFAEATTPLLPLLLKHGILKSDASSPNSFLHQPISPC